MPFPASGFDGRDLKVLHISHSLRTGGLETVISDLARHGANHGIESFVATLEHKGRIFEELRQQKIPADFLGKRPGLDWSMVGKIKKLLRKNRIDLIHAHNDGPGLYGSLAGKLCGVPTLMTRHHLSVGAGFTGGCLRKITAKLCAYSVCVSSEIVKQATEEDRTSSKKLKLILNGVDLERYKADAADRASLRGQISLSADDYVVMFVGRLNQVKNLPLMIGAIGRIADQHHGLKLILVGDGPERGDLESLVKNSGYAGSGFIFRR